MFAGLKEAFTNKAIAPWAIGAGALLAANNYIKYKPRGELDGASLKELAAIKKNYERQQKADEKPNAWNELKALNSDTRVKLTQYAKKHPMFIAGLSALAGTAITGSIGKKLISSGLIKGFKQTNLGGKVVGGAI